MRLNHSKARPDQPIKNAGGTVRILKRGTPSVLSPAHTFKIKKDKNIKHPKEDSIKSKKEDKIVVSGVDEKQQVVVSMLEDLVSIKEKEAE